MANEEHLRILKQGVEKWNWWREENSTIRPDLSNADLNKAHLSEAALSGAILSKVHFREADLSWADLSWANLSGANLSGANLSGAILSKADLSEADLSEADLSKTHLFGGNLRWANLSRADFSKAHLSRVDLSGAILKETHLIEAILAWVDLTWADLNRSDFEKATVGWTTFGAVDLRTAKGLESVQYSGPSTIGIDTVYASQGQIPEVFLRGAGVPDDFIAYISSFISGHAIQFYSCFISYSSKDQAFAERLHADLQSKGVRCWFAPEDMKIGDKLRSTIDHSIRHHDKLLLILSENSIHSDWVESEVETALEEEKKRHSRQQTVLFPIRLDDTVMETNQAWAATIRRQRHIGDFTRWKDHDSYRKAFDKLLQDLKGKP